MLILCDLRILFFNNFLEIGYICTKYGAFPGPAPKSLPSAGVFSRFFVLSQRDLRLPTMRTNPLEFKQLPC
jgi:hypothetical protein